MATTIPKEDLRAFFAELVDLPEDFVEWDGEGRRPVELGTYDAKRLVLNVVARRSLGWDEETREYIQDEEDPTVYALRRTFTGQRVVTLSLRTENFGEEEGFDLLERVRVLLGSDESRAALNELELSLNSATDVRNVDAFADDRAISVASLDVIVNQKVETVIEESGDGVDTFIETVDFEGELDA